LTGIDEINQNLPHVTLVSQDDSLDHWILLGLSWSNFTFRLSRMVSSLQEEIN